VKLKCSKHRRRVIVLKSGAVVHRGGSGTRCDQSSLIHGTFNGSPWEVLSNFDEFVKSRRVGRDAARNVTEFLAQHTAS
jgi:hypothetical protein